MSVWFLFAIPIVVGVLFYVGADLMDRRSHARRRAESVARFDAFVRDLEADEERWREGRL